VHTLGSAHVRRLVWERRQRGLRQSLVCLLADEMSWRQEIHSPRSLSVLQPISNFLCARSRSEPMSSRHKLLSECKRVRQPVSARAAARATRLSLRLLTLPLPFTYCPFPANITAPPRPARPKQTKPSLDSVVNDPGVQRLVEIVFEF